MKIVKFSQLDENELNIIIDKHYNHWKKFNDKMDINTTMYKFKELYTKNEIPYGIAIKENDNLLGFCVIKKENLKKYPEIFPWISDVMIFEEYRNKGYGRKLIEETIKILKEENYKNVYIWTDQVPAFYTKLGFEFVKEVQKNEGGTGLLFSKDIVQ